MGRPGKLLLTVMGFILWPFLLLKRCPGGTWDVLCLVLHNWHVFQHGTSHHPLLKAIHVWGAQHSMLHGPFQISSLLNYRQGAYFLAMVCTGGKGLKENETS